MCTLANTEYFISVAGFLAWGLGKGAEHGTVLLKKGSEQIISRISPGERKRVDPAAQKGVEYLRVATHTAVRVSGYACKYFGPIYLDLSIYICCLSNFESKLKEKILKGIEFCH